MEKRQIQIDSELNAIVAYDDAFRLILSRNDLREYHKGSVNWHKQPTIEISVIIEGAVNVYVLEHEQLVTKGEGFFKMRGMDYKIITSSDQIWNKVRDYAKSCSWNAGKSLALTGYI
ncbi:MAG: hypothetical protein NC434_00435 [Ruminococcus sp.]|nr:hypothetical protein [Ruminococcus sp.]